MRIKRWKQIKNILEKINGTPCEIGALVDSGKLDCYSMIGTYLSVFDLPLIPHNDEGMTLYMTNKEAAMDKACENISQHCNKVEINSRFFGDIIRARFKEEHKSIEDNSSFLAIHCGNAHVLMADIGSFRKIMPMKLKYLDILATYRIREWAV